MFPLSTVLFPHAPLPLHVFETRYRALMHDCLAGDRRFGVVLIERGSEVGGGDQRSGVGTVAHIEEASSLPDGRWVLIARGGARVRVTGWLADDPYPRAEVEELPEGPPPGDEVLAGAAAAVVRARSLLSELEEAPALPPDAWDREADATARSWRICHEAPLNTFDRQRLLEEPDCGVRLTSLVRLVTELSADLAALLGGG